MSNDRLSLQILNANRIGELDILLSSLLSQTYKEWDLILLDESDTPSIKHKHINDLIKRIRCEGHGVIYKHTEAINNIGQSRNNCYDIDLFKNELCVRIDDDSYCDVNYLKYLVTTYKHLSKKHNVGAVGGIVPVLGNPSIKKKIPKIFNETIVDKEGNILDMADDGGMDFNVKEGSNVMMPSHHLRSSFLFTRTAYESVKGHPVEYGFNGFREETDFTMKMLFAGFSLYTNVLAVCYHLRAGGGSRQKSQQEYMNLVKINDEHFRKKIKYWIQTKGNLFNLRNNDEK